MKFPIVAYISLASHVIPLLVGLYRWRSITSVWWLFFMLVVASAAADFSTFALALQRVNNLWIIHVHTLVQFHLLMFMLSAWQFRPFVQWLMRGSVVVFTAFWIVMKLTFESFTGPPTYTLPVSSLIFVAVAMYTLFLLVNHYHSVPLRHDPRFWIATAVLINFSGKFTGFILIEAFSSLMLGEALLVWQVHWVLGTIVSLFYARAFLCLPKR